MINRNSVCGPSRLRTVARTGSTRKPESSSKTDQSRQSHAQLAKQPAISADNRSQHQRRKCRVAHSTERQAVPPDLAISDFDHPSCSDYRKALLKAVERFSTMKIIILMLWKMGCTTFHSRHKILFNLLHCYVWRFDPRIHKEFWQSLHMKAVLKKRVLLLLEYHFPREPDQILLLRQVSLQCRVYRKRLPVLR